jgi:hypothetical protein
MVMEMSSFLQRYIFLLLLALDFFLLNGDGDVPLSPKTHLSFASGIGVLSIEWRWNCPFFLQRHMCSFASGTLQICEEDCAGAQLRRSNLLLSLLVALLLLLLFLDPCGTDQSL